MSKFSPKAMLIALVVMMLVVVTLFLSWGVIRIALYVPQIVGIDRVDVLCSKRPPRRQMPFFETPRRWSSDCDALRRQFGSHVSEDTFISFAYTSPADNKSYRGTLQRNWNDQNQLARTGDRIEIETSRLMAATFTDWSSPSIAAENIIRSPAAAK
ncbi:hypothetical protein [Neorhizobium galegae]|uniref:hypothetical protein n=1 Tax=Neorhizobium galegae TaxID=399 RepID=UPI00062176C7|nr:hypothetical protein [Neorhizobium galegae]MCQ1572670.1 hypothetical protein [Neorhizobium galegae]UIK07082.1 hypothetical protein LZK81_09015 [Neorhizobium galegae]CDZ72038.1 Hypothetical protein NGAL_HAMBI2610_36550 [Neorhizobium galegae bv. orientalis]